METAQLGTRHVAPELSVKATKAHNGDVSTQLGDGGCLNALQ